MSTAPPPPQMNVPPPGGDTSLALIAGLSGLIAGFIGPLIFFLIKSDDPIVREASRTALNFQISYTIWFLISGVLSLVIIGLLFLAVLWPLWFVLTIMGAVKAGKGETFSYPLSINMVK